MCDQNQIQSVNLQTAVLMQVQEYVNAGKSFSKYDVTKALRQKCNDGLLDIPECVDGSFQRYRYNVTHVAVSGVFEQLWASGVTTQGLPPLDRQFNGTFWVYSVNSSAFAQSLVTVPPTQTATLPPDPSLTMPPVSALPALNSIAGISDVEIKRRMTIYLDHCASIGLQPTLKQIQSAIKRGDRSTGLTYREIANILRGLGRSVASV